VGLTGKWIATSGQTKKWSPKCFSDVLQRRQGDQALETSSALHSPPLRHGFAQTSHADVNNCGQVPVRLTAGPRDELGTAGRQCPQFARRSTSV
jgi:hypothetical protein